MSKNAWITVVGLGEDGLAGLGETLLRFGLQENALRRAWSCGFASARIQREGNSGELAQFNGLRAYCRGEPAIRERPPEQYCGRRVLGPVARFYFPH